MGSWKKKTNEWNVENSDRAIPKSRSGEADERSVTAHKVLRKLCIQPAKRIDRTPTGLLVSGRYKSPENFNGNEPLLIWVLWYIVQEWEANTSPPPNQCFVYGKRIRAPVAPLAGTVSVEELISNTLAASEEPGGRVPEELNGERRSYSTFMEEQEREIIARAMTQADGNVTAAAKLLDLPRSTWRSKLERNGSDPE
jgi:DNA-binding protein Fis